MTGRAAGDGPSAAYYPVYLDLASRPVVIVGGGAIAAGKVGPLLEAGAELTVIAPSVEESIRQHARAGRLRWVARHFSPGDLRGARLAIDATDNGDGNRLVREDADREGCPLNSVDRTTLCDWIAPAVVSRGPLKVAISTAGESPFLAGAIRRRLEVLIGAEWEPFLRMIGALRRRLRADGVGAREQEAIYRRALRSDVRTLLRDGREDEAQDILDRLPAEPSRGRITVVVAGSASPGDLTLAAVDALQGADVIVYEPEIGKGILSARGPRSRCEVAEPDVVTQLRREVRTGADVVWLRTDRGHDRDDTGLGGDGLPCRRLKGTDGGATVL